MSVLSSADGPNGHSGNSGPYRRIFVKQVHLLIALGYARIDLESFRNAQEPAITGELVRQIRLVIEDRDSPSHFWAHRYAIHDDPPQNIPGLQGKKRPRVDIEMERTQRGPHARFQFEAKKFPVGRKDAVGEYIGENGLGSFISGRYAETLDDAGMLAYVQSGSVTDWIEKVKTRLEKQRDSCELDEEWAKAQIVEDIENCYRTVHYRKRIGGRLVVYHSFLSINKSSAVE